MKMRNSLVKYLGLFAVVFTLGLGITLMMAGTAAACNPGPCFDYFESCPSGSDCPGEECTPRYSGSTGLGACCGTVESWGCP